MYVNPCFRMHPRVPRRDLIGRPNLETHDPKPSTGFAPLVLQKVDRGSIQIKPIGRLAMARRAIKYFPPIELTQGNRPSNLSIYCRTGVRAAYKTVGLSRSLNVVRSVRRYDASVRHRVASKSPVMTHTCVRTPLMPLYHKDTGFDVIDKVRGLFLSSSAPHRVLLEFACIMYHVSSQARRPSTRTRHNPTILQSCNPTGPMPCG